MSASTLAQGRVHRAISILPVQQGVAMITTTTSAAVSAGDTVAQTSVSGSGVRTAVVSVKRTTPIKQICCQCHTPSSWKNDKLSVCTNADESVARLIDPLDFTHIQELPELVTFLAWLKQNKTVGVYNFIAKYLVDNTDVFRQEISKLSDQKDFETILEVVCRRVWQ